jgi:hypothetical protein
MPNDDNSDRWESLVRLVRNLAAGECRAAFEPHVTLRVFQHLRTNDVARRIYLCATGTSTGFEDNHPGKDIANKLIGREIAKLFKAAPIRTENVSGEFIDSYSVLSAPNWRAVR